MKLLDLKSKVWETLPGYYDGLKDNLELLIRDEPTGEAHDWQSVTLLLISLELQNQTKFYDVIYAVMPYFVTALEKRIGERDVQSQLDLIIEAGKLMLPEASKEHSKIIQDKEIIRSYEESVVCLRELAKDFWKSNQGYLKLCEEEKKVDYCIAMVAIMGESKLAGILENNIIAENFNVLCDKCDYLCEQEQKSDRISLEGIVPAKSVIGHWDKLDFGDTYIWLSNMADILGIKYIKEYLPYYFGSYTCPKCGEVSSTLEACKNDWDAYVKFVEEDEEKYGGDTSDTSRNTKDVTKESANYEYSYSETDDYSVGPHYTAHPFYSVEWFTVALYSMWLFVAIIVMAARLETLSEKTIGTNGILGGVLACVFWLIVVIISTICLRAKEDVSSYYHGNTIYVKRFGRKPIEFTYSELADYITRKKIHIKNGAVKIPYSGGRISVFIWACVEQKTDFFKLLSKKCGIEMPTMSASDLGVLRKTRFGWGWLNALVMPLLWISVGYCIAICVATHGLSGAVNAFIPLFFSMENYWGIGMLVALVVALVVKITNYFPAKKLFRNYEKVIKVKF